MASRPPGERDAEEARLDRPIAPKVKQPTKARAVLALAGGEGEGGGRSPAHSERPRGGSRPSGLSPSEDGARPRQAKKEAAPRRPPLLRLPRVLRALRAGRATPLAARLHGTASFLSASSLPASPELEVPAAGAGAALEGQESQRLKARILRRVPARLSEPILLGALAPPQAGSDARPNAHGLGPEAAAPRQRRGRAAAAGLGGP